MVGVREQLDRWIAQAGYEPSTWAFTELVYVGAVAALALALTTFTAVFAGLTSWWERRVAARMHFRIGPNRVGPLGVLQWVADALKLILKEDLISSSSDRLLFRISPYLVMLAVVVVFAVLPFGYGAVATQMNAGVYFAVSATAVSVVGILVSGWSSSSKWSLLGGMRAAAQVVSYEIPAGLALMVPVLQAGSLQFDGIIRAQGGAPWDWFVFQSPMGLVAFFVLFTALLAEGNRTPFDLPEAESELVSGYNTEYSGMRFGYFFLAEWGNLWVMGALLSALFLGGWQVPGVDARTLKEWEAASAVPGWFIAASIAVFAVKVLGIANVIIWLRWTLPRFRVDQMMSLCWKWLVPISLVLVVLTAGVEVLSSAWFGPEARGQAPVTSVRGLMHLGFFLAFGAVPVALFARKVARNLTLANERVDLSNW